MSKYAEIVDLTALGIPAKALTSFSDSEKDDALTAASGEADGYIATKHPTPLTTWPRSLTMKVAAVAAYNLISSRGMNPNSLGNELIVKRYDDAISWFGKVSMGKVVLQINVATPAATAGPSVSSTVSRYD